VLNAPHLVRAATQRRVQAAIDELGYRPHRAAQALRTRRSKLIGMRLEPIHDGINGAVLDRFLHALTERAQQAGYRIELFVAADDNDEIAQYEQMLIAADVDAFVLTSTHHQDPRAAWLADRGVPFVTFGRPWGAEPTKSEHRWVDVDGAAGTRAATQHLRRLGHERIAFLGWPAGSGVGDDRRTGWSTAMREPAATAPDLAALDLAALDLAIPDDVSAGADATRALLAREAPPTAVVCASDSLALGALTAATSVQMDLDVVGFDDTPVAAALGMSSVAQPLDAAAACVLGFLVPELSGVGPEPSEPYCLLAPRLVIRQPTFPPRTVIDID
jgi:DNA-binding LacI/PurR family transcriptional regulator